MIKDSRNPHDPWKLKLVLYHTHENSQICETLLLEMSGLALDKTLHARSLATLFRTLANSIEQEHQNDVATPICKAFFQNPELFEENILEKDPNTQKTH